MTITELISKLTLLVKEKGDGNVIAINDLFTITNAITGVYGVAFTDYDGYVLNYSKVNYDNN